MSEDLGVRVVETLALGCAFGRTLALGPTAHGLDLPHDAVELALAGDGEQLHDVALLHVLAEALQASLTREVARLSPLPAICT